MCLISKPMEAKMINHSEQNWNIGSQVKVGFLTLTVWSSRETPGDYKPDAYLLKRGNDLYEFVPHNGLRKLESWENPAELGYPMAEAA